MKCNASMVSLGISFCYPLHCLCSVIPCFLNTNPWLLKEMAAWNWCVSLSHSVSVSNSCKKSRVVTLVPCGSDIAAASRNNISKWYPATQWLTLHCNGCECHCLHLGPADTGGHFPLLGGEQTDQLGPVAPPAPCPGTALHVPLALDLWGLCFFSVVIISFIF